MVPSGSDLFAAATALSGPFTSDTGTNVDATGERGEPGPVAGPGPIASVWWQWTASISGAVEVNTNGSDFDTILAVYTGSAVNALTLVSGNDDYYGSQSRVLFSAEAGLAIGYAVGFRFHNGVAGAVGMVLVAELFGVAIACISAFVGLAIRDEESVQAFGLIWIFPLTFVSSAFVPTLTMPTWLQGFANEQPMTLVVNAMRSLAEGNPYPLNPALWQSLAWLAGVIIVFVPLAVRSYRKVS